MRVLFYPIILYNGIYDIKQNYINIRDILFAFLGGQSLVARTAYPQNEVRGP